MLLFLDALEEALVILLVLIVFIIIIRLITMVLQVLHVFDFLGDKVLVLFQKLFRRLFGKEEQ